MAALQKYLKQIIKKNKISWIRFSNSRRCIKDAINWIWSPDGNGYNIIIECEKYKIPYLVGPNILFENAGTINKYELTIINSKNCLGYFYHSRWYGKLIESYLSKDIIGKTYQFAYPVHPIPKMFNDIRYDLLIYLKHGEEAKRVYNEFRATDFFNKGKIIEFHYGTYKKRHLFKAARSSNVCLYLSYGESGGIATEEIMSCGCPIVSMESDSPLGINHKTVNWISEKREMPEIIQGIKECETYERLEVRNAAISHFSVDTISKIVLEHLEKINDFSGIY